MERLRWQATAPVEKAKAGEFEPGAGIDEAYDEACAAIGEIQGELEDYKREMCQQLNPIARSTWKYINLKPDSKDKYVIELPKSVRVPDDFQMVGKRGSGNKQVNKYN